jgi:hypothetical protein
VAAYYDKLLSQQYDEISAQLGGVTISSLESGVSVAAQCLIRPLSGMVQYNNEPSGQSMTVSEFCAWMVQMEQTSGAYTALISFMQVSQEGRTFLLCKPRSGPKLGAERLELALGLTNVSCYSYLISFSERGP